MKIEMTTNELATILDTCYLTSLTAPPFSPATSLYALVNNKMVVTNSGTCVCYLKSSISTDEPFTIPIRTTRELISLSASNKISIQPRPDRVVLEINHSRAEFLTVSPEQYPYPELPSIPTPGFNVNASRFSLALERCALIAQEAYEPRKVVYLFSLPGKKGLWCLGTDTYRVVVDNIDADADIYQTIPITSINLITRFCRACSNITIYSDEEKLVLVSEKGTIVVQSAQSLPLNLQELLEKIEQARSENSQYSVSGLSDQCAIVHAIAKQNRDIADFKVEDLSRSGDSLFLVISSQTPEHFIRVSVPVSSASAGGEEWTLNMQFLRSILAAMSTDSVRLWIPRSDSSIPAWVIAPANADFPVGMLMPVVKK